MNVRKLFNEKASNPNSAIMASRVPSKWSSAGFGVTEMCRMATSMNATVASVTGSEGEIFKIERKSTKETTMPRSSARIATQMT